MPVFLIYWYSVFLDGSTHIYMRVCPSVWWMDGWSVRNLFFQMIIMESFLNKNPWGRPTLTLLNVLDVLNVLKVLNVLNFLKMDVKKVKKRGTAMNFHRTQYSFQKIYILLLYIIRMMYFLLLCIFPLLCSNEKYIIGMIYTIHCSNKKYIIQMIYCVLWKITYFCLVWW